MKVISEAFLGRIPVEGGRTPACSEGHEDALKGGLGFRVEGLGIIYHNVP